MATFTWQSAVSGSWATDALWAGGVAPNDAAAAVALSAVGNYTVTVPGGSGFGVASVNGAAEVTLNVAGTLSVANALTAGTTVIEAGGAVAGGVRALVGGVRPELRRGGRHAEPGRAGGYPRRLGQFRQPAGG